MWHAATTVVAELHIKSLFVVVYVVFNVNNISAVKNIIFGDKSLLQNNIVAAPKVATMEPLQRYFAADITFPNHAASKVIKPLKNCFSNFRGQGPLKS
jgi:hypothetical protein